MAAWSGWRHPDAHAASRSSGAARLETDAAVRLPLRRQWQGDREFRSRRQRRFYRDRAPEGALGDAAHLLYVRRLPPPAHGQLETLALLVEPHRHGGRRFTA